MGLPVEEKHFVLDGRSYNNFVDTLNDDDNVSTRSHESDIERAAEFERRRAEVNQRSVGPSSAAVISGSDTRSGDGPGRETMDRG